MNCQSFWVVYWMSIRIFVSDWHFLLLGLFVFSFCLRCWLGIESKHCWMSRFFLGFIIFFVRLLFLVFLLLSVCLFLFFLLLLLVRPMPVQVVLCRRGVGEWFVHLLWSQDLLLQACFLPPAFTCSIQYTKCVIYMACGKVFNWRMGTRQAGLFTPSADGTNQAVLWGSWLEEEHDTRIMSTGLHTRTVRTVGLYESIWICLGWISWLHDQVHTLYQMISIGQDVPNTSCIVSYTAYGLWCT